MEKKRQAFNYNLLAAIISRSPTSGRMRYAPTVYGEKQNIKRHHPSPHPQQINGKCVGAYRIHPPRRQKWQNRELFKMELMWENLARFPRNISPGGKTLLGFRGTFSQAGKPCSVSEGHFPGWENLARFPRNISPGGKTLLGFRGTFPRAGKPCSVSEEHFPGRENLAALRRNTFPGGETVPRCAGTFSQAGKPCRAAQEHFPKQENLAALRRNIFPGRETLPRSAGTFSRAGKPCRAPREHFPRRENLAALRRNIFPSRKTLPRCAGTLLRAWKPCRAARQHFYEHENLAAFCGRVSTIICSPPSFPIRPHQGVCDTPLQFLSKNLHEMMPSITASHRTNGK